ncbi:NRDE family protein [Natronospirillum operosum]|uniref:NRDE family protein n=1 Tax=Natronospirillum operosum TaxID=2759953 RepID=A0A4Z0W5X8_9GAMM|nr:NRDE family protein [Natronospirillum operosum]TGG90096.1 NRDE family protein [Natronospirillum operosum]
MCLITFAFNHHADYPLLLAANRDEFFARPTEPLHAWPEHPGLHAGRDLQAGGTWLGVYQPTGRIAALTNVRQIPAPPTTGPSRGQLVLDVLLDPRPLSEVLADLEPRKTEYQGFNLLLGDQQGLYCVSNHTPRAEPMAAGIHGLSNATLDVPWPKVRKACARMADWADRPGPVTELAALLLDPATAAPDELPATGLSPEWEKALSAQFIQLPEYGTRASTGLMIDRQGNLHLHEQTFDAEGRPGEANTVRLEGFW